MKSSEIQSVILEVLADGERHSVQEMKQLLENKNMQDYSEGQFAGSINTLLQNKTIKKAERGVYMLNNEDEKIKKCFVISAIGDEGSDIRKNADQVFKYIIKPVCEELGFKPIRADQINESDVITETIINLIKESDLVVADITGHNPNVFFEMGYRASTGKNIIHLRSSGETLPFDVSGVRTFDYSLNDLDSVEEIKNRLRKTIGAMSFDIDDSGTEEASTKNALQDIAPLMSVLYEIKDEISELKESIRNKDTETIQAVLKAASASTPAETPETAMMKVLLPELLKNPSSFKNLLELSEMSKSKQS